MVDVSRKVLSYAERMAGYRRVLQARSTQTSHEQLRKLAADPIRPVRLWTARNERTPPDALAVLLHDRDSSVQWNALLHPAAPGGALEHLASAPSAGSLYDMIVHHPNTPMAVRDDLRRRGACRCPDWCAGQVAYNRR